MEPNFFSSKREKWLWTWTLFLIGSIYATLGLASTIAEKFYNQGFSALAFLFGMFLVGLAVIALALKLKPSGAEVGVGIGIIAVYLFVFLRMTIPERSHLIEYGVVAAFIYEALLERASQGRKVPFPWLLAILLTTLVGVIDECIQLFLPSRVFDTEDMIFNLLAATMAISGSGLFRWVRRKFGKKASNPSTP